MSKSYVLMAWPWDEVWGPVAVFDTKDAAERAQRIFHARFHGSISDRVYPRFDVREVDTNPTIEDTGTRRFGTIDEDDGGWHPIDFDEYFEDEADVYARATNLWGDYVLESESKP